MNAAFVRQIALLIFAWPFLTACTGMFYSDAQYSSKMSDDARESAVRSMRLSSAQAATAKPVTGSALVQLLSGKTHVSAYRKRATDTAPFLTRYAFFADDGSYVGRDTHLRRSPEYQDEGTWAVHAELLCITLRDKATGPDCYTIRLANDGAIQYWIHKPGDDFDGLLTLNVVDIRRGLLEPEYISDPAAFR